jgi:hypothetical protein
MKNFHLRIYFKDAPSPLSLQVRCIDGKPCHVPDRFKSMVQGSFCAHYPLFSMYIAAHILHLAGLLRGRKPGHRMYLSSDFRSSVRQQKM